MDPDTNLLKNVILEILSIEPDLYKQSSIVDDPYKLAMSAIRLRATIHELNCCRDLGIIHNTKEISLNMVIDRAIPIHPTFQHIVPDGYTIDRANMTIIVLEASTRSMPSDQKRKITSDKLKYSGVEDHLKHEGWLFNIIVISETKPRNGNVPERLLFELLKLSLSILSYSDKSSQWISEEEYDELKRSLTTYDFKTLTSEFSGTKLYTDLDEPSETLDADILSWLASLETQNKLPFNTAWDGPQITKLIHKWRDIELQPKDYKPLRLMRLMSSATTGLNLPTKHLSLLNKLKSLNLLNSRRHQNILYDYMAFMSLPEMNDYPSGWVPSVNDRLVSVKSIDSNFRQLEKLKKRLMISMFKLQASTPKGYIHDLLKDAIEMVKSCKIVKPNFKMRNRGPVPEPFINYKIAREREGKTKDYNNIDKQRIEDCALNLLLSQKTKSCPRSSNETEYFFQSRKGQLLIYKASGEGQKAFSLLVETQVAKNHHVNIFLSFNINPSRLFPLIFSSESINAVLRQYKDLLTFIDTPIADITDNVIKSQQAINPFLTSNIMTEELAKQTLHKLKVLIYGVLTNPTKRLQVELQSQRYYIMDALSLIHHKDLVSKVVGNCITTDEYFLRSLAHDLINTVLSCGNMSLFLKVTWCLNISYLCHLITKESPDRLNDMRDCFEKFMKPKIEFMSNPIINSKNVDELIDKFEDESERFFLNAPTIEVKPSVYKPVMSDFLRWVKMNKFNGQNGEPLLSDENVLSSSVDVLDLTSNKSTFKRTKNGEIESALDVLYNPKLIIKRIICEKLHKNTVKSSSIKERNKGITTEKSTIIVKLEELSSTIERIIGDEGLLDELEYGEFLLQMLDVADEIKEEITNKAGVPDEKELTNYEIVLETISSIVGTESKNLIKSTCMSTKLSDLTSDILSEDCMKEIIESVITRLPSSFPRDAELVSLDNVSAGLVVARLQEGDIFSSFKFLLLWAGFNNFQGTYTHHSGPQSSILKLSDKYRKKMMISSRVTNSESIQERLLNVSFGAPTLRNILFSTLDMDIKNSEIGPNNKLLQFGLSFKEQVGGPRELYVGDSDTKLITRVLEESSRNLGSLLENSCLSSEKKFDSFMKEISRAFYNGYIILSMDHSKWGPYNSPIQYHMLYEALEEIRGANGKKLNLAFAKTILKWHLFKAVEVPVTIIEDIYQTMTDISLNNRERRPDKERSYETYFINQLKTKKIKTHDNKVPSQIHSYFDMGQGILHYTSDLYGSLASEYICNKVNELFNIKLISMNTSDDMVVIVKRMFRAKHINSIREEMMYLMNYIYALSNFLNKHVSPKYCCSPLVGEFKSHFEVEGKVVPLFIKFFSACIGNFRCKNPTELFNTCDTIVEQGVCNGLSLTVADCLKKRMVNMLDWLGYSSDPQMHPHTSRQQDWLMGCLSYRKLRSLETWLLENGVEELTLDVVRGKLYEVIQSLRMRMIAPIVALEKMRDVVRTHLGKIDIWFPTLWGGFRLIVRSKLNLGQTLVESCENPLVKKLMNHYSRFTKQGLGLLISEGLERSAFQSSVVTGFIGLSISLSGPCVKSENGNFIPIHQSKQITKEVCEVYTTLLMDSVCSIGDWVCGEDRQLNKFQPHGVYVRTSLINTPTFNYGLDELTATLELTSPELFDKFLATLVPIDKRLNLRTNWSVRPEMELLVECSKLGMSVFDGKFDRKEESVMLTEYFKLEHLVTRSLPLQKTHKSGTAVQELNRICDGMILSSILRPQMVEPSLIGDVLKTEPFTSSLEVLKDIKVSGLMRYIKQVLLGRKSYYKFGEEHADGDQNLFDYQFTGTPEEPIKGYWTTTISYRDSKPKISLTIRQEFVEGGVESQAVLATVVGRPHLQDFLLLKRKHLEYSDYPESIDLIEFGDVKVIEKTVGHGQPVVLYMASLFPIGLTKIAEQGIGCHNEKNDATLKSLLKTAILNMTPDDVSLLPRSKLDAIDHVVRNVYLRFNNSSAVSYGLHKLQSFEKILQLNGRIYETKESTLVFHHKKGVLVEDLKGLMSYKTLRVSEWREKQEPEEARVEVLEE